MKKNQFCLLAVMFAASLSAHAGVLIEFVTRNATTGKEAPLQTMLVQDGIARMESISGKARVATLFKNDAMYILDDATKTYRVMDKATMEQTANLLGDAMTKMRAQMEKMPPDQRAMMEQMLKQQGAGAMLGSNEQKTAKPVVYDAQPLNGSETIEGKSCKLWNVTRDGVPSQQLCVVPISAMPGSEEVVALSKKMAAMFETLTAQLREQMPGVPQQAAALTKINGYPIMTRTYRDGVLQPDQFVVKTWKQQAIDAAKFEVPPGYKKQEMNIPKTLK